MTKKISDINYWGIFKKAFQNTWESPRLLWFGLFISLTSGGSLNYSYSPEENDPSWQKVEIFLSENIEWILPLIIILFLLFLTIMVFGILSRGGLLLSLEKIEKGAQGLGFKEGIYQGKKYFWKLLFLGILLGLSFFFVLAIISVPIILLFTSKHFVLGTLLALLGIAILAPIIALFFFLSTYGQIYIVLANMKIWPALEASSSLFMKNIFSSVVMSLLFIPIKIILGISVLVMIIFIGIAFAVLTGLLFLASKVVGLIIGITLGILAISAVLLFISSAYQVFRQSAWLLFFREIAVEKQEEAAEPKLETETARSAPATDRA